jgi:hypothetical protein
VWHGESTVVMDFHHVTGIAISSATDGIFASSINAQDR